jgi:hypothetical protein
MAVMFGFRTPLRSHGALRPRVGRALAFPALFAVAACNFDAGSSKPGLTATLGAGTSTSDGSTEDSIGASDTSSSLSTSDVTSDDPADTTTEPSPCGVWWNDAWSRRTRLRFRGGEHDVLLVDMPVLVKLTPTRIDQDAVAADASDLRFVDVNGTLLLPHEIEHWDPTGDSYIWVRIPTVPYLDDTYSFWVYYGNPDAGSVESGAEVWSAGYRGVWHLDAAQGPLRNSAEDTAHGEAGSTEHQQNGKIASARRFGGWDADDQIIALGPGSQEFFDGWSSFTLNLWMLPDYPDDATWEAERPGRFLGKGGPMFGGLATRTGGSAPGEGETRVGFGFEPGQNIDRSVTVARGAWSWITYTFDGDTLRTYHDGVEVWADRVAGERLIGGTNEVFFGHYNQPLRGAIDEVRFADVARDPVWIEAQYRSMTDQLLAYSNPESCP